MDDVVKFQILTTWESLRAVRRVLKDATQSAHYSKTEREAAETMLRKIDHTLGGGQ